MDFPEIQGYKLLDVIGKGGMGVVYRANHLALDRTVALKVLHKVYSEDPEFVKSFAQEAKVIARLSHPHIVSVYDFGQTDGIYYLSMQYVLGKTVADVLETRKLSLQEISAILLHVADALDFAHRSEVVHRDVKPGNIMLLNDGRAMIMDFGVASAMYGSGPGSVWVAAGSPSYMSPEQCLGRGASPRSDQYSLGIAVYEMVTGRLPFPDNDPVIAMRQQINDTPPPMRMGRTDISPRLEAAMQRVLSKLPEMRFQSVTDFAREFEAAYREMEANPAMVHGVPGIGQRPAPGGMAARGHMSLVDGGMQAAPARPDPMQGYVFKAASPAFGRRSMPVWAWVLIFVLIAGCGTAAYFALRPAPPLAAPETTKGGTNRPKSAPNPNRNNR